MKFIIEAIGVKSAGGVELVSSLLAHFPHHRNHQFVALLADLPRYADLDRDGYRVLRFSPNLGLVNRHFILNRDIPRICKEEGANALLCLGNFAPSKPSCPTVVLLQNAWNVYDEPVAEKRMTLKERLVVAYGRRLYRHLPPQTRVIVQTPVMKERLASYHRLDSARISVVASAPPVLRLLERSAPQACTHRREVFSFLCMSGYYGHKNLEVLIDSVRILPRLSAKPFRCLVTISAERHPGARKLLARIRTERLEDVLVNLGPVPRSELSRVYAQADAYLLPTLLETVGFTYDEAMHFGLPIVTSDRDFARDRCRDAAIYFDPLDAQSVAETMARVMEDENLRRRLVENGRRLQKQAPSWEDVASQFVTVLEGAVDHKQPAPQRRYDLSS